MAAEALEQSMLESKDKDQLLAIAQALGIKTTARASKATLIGKILESTGVSADAAPVAPVARVATVATPARGAKAARTEPEPADEAPATADEAPAAADEPEVVLGPDGEPLSDWEIELVKAGEIVPMPTPAGAARAANGNQRASTNGQQPGQQSGQRDDDDDDDDEGGEGGESRNSRRRRRRRNKNRSGAEGEIPQPGQNGNGQNGNGQNGYGQQGNGQNGNGQQGNGQQGNGQQGGHVSQRAERHDREAATEATTHEWPAISTCATKAMASCASTVICPAATMPTSR